MPKKQDATLDEARRDAGLSHGELWVRYFALGGMAVPTEVRAYLLGVRTPSEHDHEVLVHALNERFTELGRNHPVPHLDGPSNEVPSAHPRDRDS